MKDTLNIASNRALRSLRTKGAAAFARAFRERKQTDPQVAALALEGVFDEAAALLDAHVKALDSFAEYLDEWDPDVIRDAISHGESDPDAIRDAMEGGIGEAACALLDLHVAALDHFTTFVEANRPALDEVREMLTLMK